MTDLNQIYHDLKPLLQEYSPPFVPKKDEPACYDLWSLKKVIIAGRTHKEVYFAGLTIQKSFVGFYYMPVYMETGLKNVFPPDLLKLLKGKSCFHIKKLDENLLAQIRKALKIGFDYYQKNDWV